MIWIQRFPDKLCDHGYWAGMDCPKCDSIRIAMDASDAKDGKPPRVDTPEEVELCNKLSKAVWGVGGVMDP
jgi:hypothetical protein